MASFSFVLTSAGFHFLLLLHSCIITTGFHINNYSFKPERRNTYDASLLLSASSSDQSFVRNGSSRSADTNKRLSPVSKRRTFLAKIVATGLTSSSVLYYRGWRQPQQQQDPTFYSSGENLDATTNNNDDSKTQNRLLSLDQAVMLLEASCDRRFLHAVVSSDYNLMYRGIAQEDSKYPATIQSEPSDLLLESTYGSIEAVNYFKLLENEIMSDKPIRPSNGHLATTNVDAAKRWGGYAASVWPLSDGDSGKVHFAWLEEGGDFWPSVGSSRSTAPSSVIVDGIDCGRLSLEDALERENSEIMFRADRYLAVPISMEEQLLSRLRNSFII